MKRFNLPDGPVKNPIRGFHEEYIISDMPPERRRKLVTKTKLRLNPWFFAVLAVSALFWYLLYVTLC